MKTNEKEITITSKRGTKIAIKHTLYAMLAYSLGNCITWIITLFSMLPIYEECKGFIWFSYGGTYIILGIMFFLVIMTDLRNKEK